MSRRWHSGTAAAALVTSVLAVWSAEATADEAARQVISEDPVRMVVQLDRSTARVAEPITLSVHVEAPRSAEVEMPALESPQGPLKIRELRRWDALPGESTDETAGRQPVRRWIRRARLESIRAGEFELPPLEVRYRLAPDSPWQSLRSEPVAIRVRSVLAEDADPRAFRELKPPVAVEPAEPSPARWREAFFGTAAALLIAVAIVTYRMARRRRLRPVAIARRRLDQLTERLTETGDTAASGDAAYLELEQILRDFLAQRFDFAAHSQSTDELVRWIDTAGILGGAERAQLEKFLRGADRIKYARQAVPRGESERAIAEAREVIDRLNAAAPAPARAPAREVA